MIERFVDRIPLTTNKIESNLKYLKRGKISFDLDAITQATFHKALTNLSLKLGLIKPISKHQMITYWELKKISESHGISVEESLDFSKSAWNNDLVYRTSPVMPGITSLLKVLRDIEFPHIFISSRPADFLTTTQEWFAKRFDWIPPEDIKICRPSDMHGGIYKASQIELYQVGLHIEDATEEVTEIAARTRAKQLVLPQPWNILDARNGVNVRVLGNYSEHAGSWPVLKFLASDECKSFFELN